jgi:hypothetical protein
MAVINNGTVNPLSTVEPYGPDTRGPQGQSNSYIFTAVEDDAVSLPKIESYPAMFSIIGTGTSLQPAGFVTVTAAGNLVVSGATANLSTSAGANILVPSVSGGVLTLTPNATFTARDIVVTRIG